jgi:hypothetical protein
MLSVTISTAMKSTSIVVSVPSSAPPILIVSDLVLNGILVRKGATKECKTKLGKTWT